MCFKCIIMVFITVVVDRDSVNLWHQATGMDLICKAILISVLVSKYFFIVHSTNFIHASTWAIPLVMVWWWFFLIYVHFFAEAFEKKQTKLVPVSDIILLDSPYSASIILQHFIRLSVDKLSACFTTGDFLWQSTIQRKLLLLVWTRSVSNTSHGLSGVSCGIILSFGYICWNLRHVEQLLTVFLCPHSHSPTI